MTASNASKSENAESSGLRDILAVAASLQDADEEEGALQLFSNSSSDDEVEDLTGGFGGSAAVALVEQTSEADAVPAAAAEAATVAKTGETSTKGPSESSDAAVLAVAAPATARAEEGGSGGKWAIAAVVAAAIVGGGFWLSQQNQQPEAQATAERDGDRPGEKTVAVAQAEPDAADAHAPLGAEAGPDGDDAEQDTEQDTGEDEQLGLDPEALADAEMQAGDPLADDLDLNEPGEPDPEPAPEKKKRDSDKKSKGKAKADPGEPEPEPEPEAEPEPEPEVEPEAEPEPAGEPVKGGDPSKSNAEVDCLLNPAAIGCEKKTGPSMKTQKTESLPEKLSQSQLSKGFSKVKKAAEACGGKHGGAPGTKVKVHVSIEGESGAVTKTTPKGDQASSDLGKCVADALSKAKFEKFSRPAMGIDWTVRL